MTTRRDKIDNFWFVLRHECEHVLQGHGRERRDIDANLEGEKASTSDRNPQEERLQMRQRRISAYRMKS